MPHRSSNIGQPCSRYAKHTRSQRSLAQCTDSLPISSQVVKRPGDCLKCELGSFSRNSPTQFPSHRIKSRMNH